MKQTRLRMTALALLLTFGLLAGCAPKPTPTPTPTPSSVPSTPTPTPDDRPPVRVGMLNGPTGMGAAKLMADDETDATALNYTFTLYQDNNEAANALLQGELDIAALATNVAASLYNKTQGGIQLAAVNTYGVLKLLQSGEEEDITSLGDLEGRTLCCVGQGANPEYILTYLLREHGLDAANDVDIRWMTAEEATGSLLTGTADLAILPVPAATVALMRGNGSIRQVLDLSEEWDRVTPDSPLAMGCVVVRTQFAQEQPDVVRTFLEEYRGSVTYMSDPENLNLTHEDAPHRLLERFAILPSADVARDAIPQANLTCLAGAAALRDAVQGCYEVLYAADPASIGGGIPDDAFYFE